MFDNENRHYSLRKLSVGLASVLIGISFASSMTGSNVKADTVSTQTSAIETKTSENNNVDVNADASKEVVKSINSVNANKLTPSQTVLNKQATSNDVLKGKDVKQEQVVEPKQETPVKQTPVKKQPVVSNKDANINLNSNLNKNTNKQTLADNLLKDTTKPETTNTLNVTKTSQAPIAENMLKEDKTQVTQNQDWADPAKQGYHKTTAGWVRNSDNYAKSPYVAKKSSIQIMNNLMKNNNLEVPIDNSNNNYSSVHIKATIDKSLLNNASGREFLLGSVAILNQDKRFNEIDVFPEHVPVYTSNNSALGYIEGVRDTTYDYPSSVKITGAPDGQNMHTIKYVFHLNKNENFADDLAIDSTFTSIGLNPWNTHYYGLRGTSKTNPFNSKWITNDYTYSVKVTVQDHDPWEGQWPNYQPSAADANKLSTSIDGNGYTNIFGAYFSRNLNSKMPDKTYHRVFQISSLPNDDGSINKINFDNSFMTNRPQFWAVSPDGTKLAYTWVPRNNSQNLKKLADSLTPKQVYDASYKNDTGAYSVQQDGSIIFSYNYNPSTFFKIDKNAQNLIDASIENGYAYNIWAQNDKMRKQIMDQTHAQFEKSNHQAMNSRLIIEHLILQDNSKPARLVLIDLTDGSSSSSTTNTQNVVFTPLGAHTQTSIYKQINVKFVDDTDSKKVLSTKPIFKGTNHTLNVTLSPENTDSTLTHIDIPSSYALSDMQPDLSKFNYDPATKTFHYGVVKNTNPDIIIHVKHKIVKGVSGDDKMLDNYPNIKKALNGEIKLVANYTYPDNGKFTDERAYPKQKVFSLTLKRSADVDLTIDSIVRGTAGAWSAVNQNGIAFNNGLVSSGSNFGETLPEGYTLQNGSDTTTNAFDTNAFQTSARNAFASLRNAGGLVTKVFNYVIKADPQKIQVKFVDDDDPNKAQVGDIITVNGVTDGQADFKDAIAAYNQDQAKYYVLAKDQTDPNTLKHTFIANDSTMLTVHLKHKHQDVTMSDPKAETTREYRVIERRPAQYGGSKIGVDLVVHAHKTADKDLVTGNITYGNYLGKTTTFEVKAGHPKYANDLSYFNSTRPDKINGYITIIQNNWSSPERDALAPNQSSVLNHMLCFYQYSDGTYSLDFMDGNPHDGSSNRAFTTLPASRDFYVDYVAKPQSIQVKFIDQDNAKKQVGDVIKLTGVTDSNADFTSVVNTYKQDNAKHYLFVNTDPSQLSHKFTAGDKTIITIDLKHQHAKSTVQAPATRTIVVHMPDGSTKTYVQTIDFVNNLDEDLVTNVTTNVYTVDASKSNVTVNGTVDSNIQAYRKTGNDDATGTNYKFASFVLPKVPGYRAYIKPVSINSNMRLFSVSFMALPKPVVPAINDAKPTKTVTPAATEAAELIKTEPNVTISATPKAIDLSNDVVATTPDVSTWQVADEPEHDTYHISNGKYAVELPHISNAELHVIATDSTKDSVLFTYKGQNIKYVFNIKFVDGHYLLTTYEIKSGKLVKLIDYNFIKSSKMINVIVDWIKLK